jgi:Ser/Thr protein kinase RdoA (MazF antagonist)
MTPHQLAVCSSVVSPDALAQWLPTAYPLRPPLCCRLHRRSASDAYRIESADGMYFLKILTCGWRTCGQMQSEVELLEFLIGHGVRVVRPIRRLDGGACSPIRAPEGVRPAVLYAAARGDAYDHTKSAHNQAFGEELAKLHRTLDAFDRLLDRASLDLDHLLDHYLTVIRPWMERRQTDLDWLSGMCRRLRVRIEALLARTPPVYGICHGDAHGANALFGPEGCTLFDFDNCGLGFRAFDVAVFVGSCRWMDTDDESRVLRARIQAELLEGYAGQCSLSPAEIEAIELFQPAYHLWLMGYVLEWSTRREGVHWADDRFLDWHMDWFRWWESRRG